MATFTFAELLKPFEYLDISSLYNSYSLIIDAIIAFFIFFGIAKVTLGKRFEGRGGKAIVIGVGLALSTGFLLMEKTLNFSLHSFGPLAVGIILLLVGFVLFTLLLSLGFNHTNSLCLAYIIDYLSLRLVSPTIFDWIAQTAPFINGILGIGFIIALIKLLFSFFSRNSLRSISSGISKIPTNLNPKTSNENFDKEIAEDKEEAGLIRTKLIKATKREIKDSNEMIEAITEMIKLIEEYGTAPHAIREVSNHLVKIRDKEHYAMVYFNYINKIMDKIGRFDNEFYTTLKAEYETAQGSEQKRLKKKEIEAEEKKREIEEVIEKIEKLILKHTKEFNQCINYAVQSLRNNNPNEAVRCLKESLRIESKIKDLFIQMKGLEGNLRRLTKRDIKFLRKEKKRFS
jgi:hypothetical protein